jgi:hypothetical protein
MYKTRVRRQFSSINDEEYMTFADFNEDEVIRADVRMKYNRPAKVISDIFKNEMEATYYTYKADLKKCTEPVYGFSKERFEVYVLECVGWYIKYGNVEVQYKIASILKFSKKSKIIAKLQLLNGEAFPRQAVLANISEAKKYGREEPLRMSMSELVSKEHRFNIQVSNINILPEDLNKISEAWALNYKVYYRFCGSKFEDLDIEIFTSREKESLGQNCYDIKKEWNKIIKILRKQELPTQWVDEAITYLQKEKDKEMEEQKDEAGTD